MTQTTAQLATAREPLIQGPSSTRAISSKGWLQIGVIAVLLLATFYRDILRLWDLTNPFYGEANWAHAMFVPLLGLYYLYLNREALLAKPVRPFVQGSFTRPNRLWIGAGLVVTGLIVNGCLYGLPNILPRWWGWLALAPVGGAIAAFPIELHRRVTPKGRVFIGSALIFFSMEMVLGRLSPATANYLSLTVAAYGVAVIALDWSLGTTAFGLLLFTAGIWPVQNNYVQDSGMILALFGIVLLLCGWDIMRIAWFPIFFLFCALPWPPLIYQQIAAPLQTLAAQFGVWTLQATGVAAQRIGNTITLGQNEKPLNVAEACAGLRSLMTFITLGAAWAFLISNRPLWQKVVITASAVPIAVFCNVARVAGQGLLHHYVSAKLSESFAHQFIGLFMVLPGFFLIMLVAWILDRIFIEETDPGRRPRPERREPDVLEVKRPGTAAAPRTPAVAVAAAVPMATPRSSAAASPAAPKAPAAPMATPRTPAAPPSSPAAPMAAPRAPMAVPRTQPAKPAAAPRAQPAAPQPAAPQPAAPKSAAPPAAAATSAARPAAAQRTAQPARSPAAPQQAKPKPGAGAPRPKTEGP